MYYPVRIDSKLSENGLRFSVDSRLLGELGERLVSKNYIALAELIKNAYDADSTKIRIRFSNAKTTLRSNEIELIDNGHGMTFNELQDYWMRIATENKERNPVSTKFGRKKTGSKGIGRFACRRLAQKLIIETIAKNKKTKKYEKTSVIFDWKNFVSGSTLTEIPSKYTREIIKKSQTGTILRLIGLKEKWSDRNFQTMNRQIITLCVTKGIKKEGFIEDPGFEIVFEAPEFSDGIGKLAEKFMDAGWGKVIGKSNVEGQFKLELDAMKIEKQHYELPLIYPMLCGIEIEIAILFLNSKYIRDKGILTKSIGSEILEDQGGVRVYLDGFRIYPYGESGDDWLGIDKKKVKSWGAVDETLRKLAIELGEYDLNRAMLSHPRNDNLIGKIMINSQTNNNFEVKIDREGFLENEAFKQLRNALSLILEWTTLQYNKSRLIIRDEELKETEEQLLDELKDTEGETEITKATVRHALNLLSIEIKRGTKHLKNEEKKKVEERFEIASEIIERKISRSEAYVSVLSAAASSGTYLLAFSHDIKSLYSSLHTYANTLRYLRKKIPDEYSEEIENIEHNLRNTKDRFNYLIEILSFYSRISNQTQKTLLVREEIEKLVKGFDFLIKKYGKDKSEIHIEYNITENLTTGLILESEFFSIIVNLLSNSIKAVIAGNGNNIKISAKKINNMTLIRIENDGIELAKENWIKVFDPLIADIDNKIYSGLKRRINDDELAALGKGSGLGLTIIKNIVEKYNGRVKFVNSTKPFKTTIEVIIP